ncbi:MAG: VTT domain-containing protein [Gammaproteobacteria bacterium]|nr:VTT domain-containing protein [Gammaproteobacteria bacterium]MBT8444249.1 VTT domain-containing protein [Gammaproteobacteria bacterium]NND37661.1 TVP38/TMEM64 family protein [Gammaproteobacteria bacterium]
MNPETSNPRIGSTSTRVRAAVLVLIVAAGFALARWTPVGDYLSEERLVGLLTEISQIWWAPLALLTLYAILAPLGMTMVPMMVAGSIFGPWLGSFYNSLGVLIGAIVSFWLARSLGRDFVLQITGDRFRRAERFTDRHGFWPLVQTRFLPLPFPVVNFGAALAGVSPGLFIASAVVGIVPSTVLHTFFISNIMFAQGSERAWYGVAYLGSFVAFNLVIGIPWIRGQRRRRRRYNELLATRSQRTGKTDP